MALRTFGFNTGPDGATIVQEGDIVEVNGATYTNLAQHGAHAMEAATGDQWIRVWDSENNPTHSGSLYVAPRSAPSSGAGRLVTFTDDFNANLAAIRLHNNGLVDIASASNASQVSSSVSWSVDAWMRLDWQWDDSVSGTQAAPILTVRIYLTPEASTHDDEISWQASSLTEPIGRWLLGAVGGTSWAADLDTLRVQDGLTWMSPYAPGAGTVVHTWSSSTAGSIRVAPKTSGATSLELLVATDSGMTQVVATQGAKTPDSAGYTDWTVTGLDAGTEYWYQLRDTPPEGSATLIGTPSRTKTMPAGASSYTLAFGSCESNAGDSEAWNDIVSWNPDLVVHLGDWHYHEPNSTDPSVHRGHVEQQIQDVTGLASALSELPVVYTRSDHDVTGNNGDTNNDNNLLGSMPAYAQYCPHPTFGTGAGTSSGLWFSLAAGRTRIIVLDTRSYDRSPGTDPQSPSKTMLGSAQKSWLFDELTTTPEPVKLIVSDVGWIGPASADADLEANGKDKWWAYDDERSEIGQYIVDNSVNVILLQGDNHALLSDDGTNNQWGGFPVFGAAPFSQTGGGRYLSDYQQSYSSGASVGHHYGRLTITDTGEAITVAYDGYDVDNTTAQVSESVTFSGLERAGSLTYWDGSAEVPVRLYPRAAHVANADATDNTTLAASIDAIRDALVAADLMESS